MKEIESIPNASRTLQALKNLGYDINSSIADVVDNSISAKVDSNNIDVSLIIDPSDNIVCRIQDDGCGMDENTLKEAMRFGTDTTYENNSLGKFGMGMKTASLSHCDVLTVISKTMTSDISGFRWDIRKINHSPNKWTLLHLTKREIQDILDKENLQLSSQGTIVMWDELFSINEDYHSYQISKFANNYYFRICSQLKVYLGMIYHRFLEGSVDNHPSFNLTVNGEPVTPWDPFWRSEENTEEIHFNKGFSELFFTGCSKPVRISGYVLPNKEGFSTEEAWKNAKGLLSWNDSQGYYIYRANRMIRFGGWHGTKAKDEHDKLARLSIDIDPSLDELFRITVNKSKVQFPEKLFLHLKQKINPKIIGKAKSKYNKSKEKLHVKNKIRSSEKGKIIPKELLSDNNIHTNRGKRENIGFVEVNNPNGTWLANRINDFLKYGTSKDFEIISENLKEEKLWKIVCHSSGKFKVIVNASHPFYLKYYNSSTNKAVTEALDALIFSLAFAELYNRNDQNSQLFKTYKTVCSKSLERLLMEGII